MVKQSNFFVPLMICCACCMLATSVRSQQLTGYVNPYIGTASHGHVFLGANVPYGAVQLGPVNLSQGWDWCSGYNYADSTIIGFSHTHLSGTGIGDLGDILVMPIAGKVSLFKGHATNLQDGYLSVFHHDREHCRPGYYSVMLDKYGIFCELTATARCGLHRYYFPPNQQAHVLIDLVEGIGWDRPREGTVRVVDDSTLAGYRFSSGWAEKQRIFFVARFSRPFRRVTLYKRDKPEESFLVRGDSVKAVMDFSTEEDTSVMMKVAISPVSEENALLNLDKELPDWDFDAVVSRADSSWNKELGKIQIKTKQRNRKMIFYTSLFHTMIAPSLFNDVNGDYYGTDRQVHHAKEFNNLTTFSLWDTYRCANALFTLIEPDRVRDMVRTMLAIYEQQGRLPVWPLVGNETFTMPGNSAIPVIADAYLKGIGGFDSLEAFRAIKETSMLDDRGLGLYRHYGFIPADSMTESVSTCLEYAIDDRCAALMASALHLNKDASYFLNRSLNYRNVFDSSVGFMRGRWDTTRWASPFDPIKERHMKDDFTEGNAWQYSWLVPEDVSGLVKLMGGETKFIEKLDLFFRVTGDMGKEASNDITGLIGQYAHGNEPSHHIAYLYSYVGQPWKTAQWVRYILDSLYSVRYDGICGNEDVGQMSAWYILSSLGFYPVHPAGGIYVMGSPIFDEALINVGKGRYFHIQVENNSNVNKYIQSMSLNGKPYLQSYLLHSDIIKGGNLVIRMGRKPSSTFGINPIDRPGNYFTKKNADDE